jgi:DNA-binding MarR family transcriptional regulator
VGEPVPLPTLLSQALVAFTIEFDNEAEHRLTDRTTVAAGPAGAPWLVSQVMWANVLQYVGAEGVRVAELHARARTTRDSLGGLQRWGYVVVHGEPAADPLVGITSAGRSAQEIWRPLALEVEGRWRGRFGPQAVETLRRALEEVVGRFDVELPDYLPIVYPTSNGKAEIPPRTAFAPASRADRSPDLSVLLAQALLGFTLDFEAGSKISLPISANTLRVLTPTGVRVRELPLLTGVSKEANAMAVGFLERHGCAAVEPDASASRGKVVRLTAKGQRAQAKYVRVLGAAEEEWVARFGPEAVQALREALERVVGPALLDGVRPYPDGWRASVRPPSTLPHYPMVLHRGGYPDGS